MAGHDSDDQLPGRDHDDLREIGVGPVDLSDYDDSGHLVNDDDLLGPGEEFTGEVRVVEVTRDDEGHPIKAETVEHYKVENGTRIDLAVDPHMPEDMVVAVDPKTKEIVGAIVGAIVDVGDTSTTPPAPPPDQVSALGQAVGSRWTCTACNATWDTDPGPFHTHEVPVPGSKSRVTYEQKPITKTGG